LKNPYEVLGISPSSTNEEVRDAYRALAKKYHQIIMLTVLLPIRPRRR
jgi:preprotein translocase subunit Sec63